MRHCTLALIAACGTNGLADTLNVPSDFPTIQAALDAASDGDEVVLAPGMYSESLDLLGKRLTLRSSAGPAETTLDGAGLGDSILRAVSGETLDTVVRGLTFTNGEGGDNPNCTTSTAAGGAAYIRDSELSFEDCDFVRNGFDLALAAGGAICVMQGGVRLSGCSFVENGGFVSDPDDAVAFGAAVYFCNRSFVGTFEVDDCQFIDNGPASHGGGIWIVKVGDITITDSIFVNNGASFGGGINVSSDRNENGLPATIRIERCDFIENFGGFAGGLFASIAIDIGLPPPDPQMIISDCVFQGNTADGCCNTGIYWTECYQDGSTNGRFFGGAADIRTLYGGRIEINNCLVTDNDATLAGGFHLATCGGGEILLNNATFADNATSGLHVREGFAPSFQTDGSVAIANTISTTNGDSLADNLITEIDDDPQIAFETRYSLVEGGFPGDGNIDTDPVFVDPLGGDYRLDTGSPAIDAADNAAVPDDIETDLAGEARFVDDPDTADTGVGPAPIVDMGAYEFQLADCPADLDGDGDADADDFFTYLDLFAAGDDRADIDGDGDLDAEDFFGYLDLFTRLC